LPLDLILTFVNRPHHMDAVEFAEAQRLLRDRVNELVNVGELLKMEREENVQKYEKMGWREKRNALAEEKKTWIRFKQAVYLMEEDAEEFANCTENYRNYNPLIPIFSLMAGICALIISLCWVLQIILYMLPSPPVTPFLNDYFRWFETWFNLFGVLSVNILLLPPHLCGEGLLQIRIAIPLLSSPSNEIEQDVHVIVPFQHWPCSALRSARGSIQLKRISRLCPIHYCQPNIQCPTLLPQVLWVVLEE